MAAYKEIKESVWNGIDFSDLLTVRAISIVHVRETDAPLIPVMDPSGFEYEYTRAGAYKNEVRKLEILVRTSLPADRDLLDRILQGILNKSPKANIKMLREKRNTLVLIYNTDDSNCTYKPELNIHAMGTPSLCPECNTVVTNGMMHPNQGAL